MASLAKLGAAVLAALAGLVIGPFAWAVISGAAAGVLDAVGIVIPASTYIALAPVASVAGGAAGAWVVIRR